MSPYTSERCQENRNSNTITETFEWEQREAVALAIVETVASITGQDTTELSPLSHTIDTDALNTLFRSTDATDRRPGCVKFPYENCQVEVSADGQVSVTPADA